MSEHLPAPDINPDDCFCDICGDAICPGIKIRCHSCEIAYIYIIEPLKARIKALEENRVSRSKLLEKALTRNGALEGVVEHWKDAFEKQIYLIDAKDDKKTSSCRECWKAKGKGHDGNCSYRKYYVTAKKLEGV